MTINQIPYLQFYSFDTTEISDPSGERNGVGKAFAFDRVLSSGICSSGLIFPDIEVDLTTPSDHYVSTPVAIIFRLDNVTTLGSGIDKFRLYLADDSAFDYTGSQPKPFLQLNVSGIWQPNCQMGSGIGTRMYPGVIPESPNMFRQDSKIWIDGVGDLDVSTYAYLNVVYPDYYPLGQYGVCGSGNIRIALKYDYASIL